VAPGIRILLDALEMKGDLDSDIPSLPPRREEARRRQAPQ
jgi:hypothetical protein